MTGTKGEVGMSDYPERDGIVAIEGYYRPEALIARCVKCENVREVCCSEAVTRTTDNLALVYKPTCSDCCDHDHAEASQ